MSCSSAQKSEKNCLIIPQGTEGKALNREEMRLPAERRRSLRRTPGKAVCKETPTTKTSHYGPWLIINPETTKSSLQSWSVLCAHPNTSSNCQLWSTNLRKFISINNTLSKCSGKTKVSNDIQPRARETGKNGRPKRVRAECGEAQGWAIMIIQSQPSQLKSVSFYCSGNIYTDTVKRRQKDSGFAGLEGSKNAPG